MKLVVYGEQYSLWNLYLIAIELVTMGGGRGLGMEGGGRVTVMSDMTTRLSLL